MQALCLLPATLEGRLCPRCPAGTVPTSTHSGRAEQAARTRL
ncbi:rCG60937 [Rattus norvegicus]|uniref:RCG60937 n=1 Tax=Rattus norvegicus TaxID=10116 RepID=A6JJP7_RAT|nr:rCG60937 [Rattus norvegicus]